MRYLIVIAGLLASQPIAEAYDRQKMIEPFFSTVMVRGYRADGGLGYGSGIVVASNKVLTNCHIFRETGRPWVSRGEDVYEVESVQADRWHDLCLLKTAELPFKPVQIGESNHLKKGQEVTSIGHSNGVASPMVSVGSIKSIYSMDQGNIIRSSAKFSLGASGSGLYDMDGKLIGINTFKTIGRQAYYYAMPVEWLTLLQQREPETQFPLAGQALWEASEQSRLYFLLIAIPELKKDWQAMADIASRWTQVESDSSEAWYELGYAQEQLSHLNMAEESYKRAIALDEYNTDALFRLGIIASRHGDKLAADQIEESLGKISENLAAEFRKAIACTGAC
ncbi:trypsin-like peptidase domain-containing protein [Methylobacillus caricis]|uniref:trypsin-like peptidase domain-containing protein n=1 Tax=Methylobacillus caricis TaxID=1971611 RepID=UPI001D001049|nr:trypsin-like peptidase domain-containing protein [Methylobacillus caricis]MCB5187569.1 trypsin-like peptidase domain-containing protein [Methylobacillus caricis]